MSFAECRIISFRINLYSILQIYMKSEIVYETSENNGSQNQTLKFQFLLVISTSGNQQKTHRFLGFFTAWNSRMKSFSHDKQY